MSTKKFKKVAFAVVSLVLASTMMMGATCDSDSSLISSISEIVSSGDSTSGSSTDGSSTDGDSTGSESTGNESTGGDSTGSESTGNESTGGDSTGSDSGSSNTGGGSSSDDDDKPSEETPTGGLTASQKLLTVSTDKDGDLSYTDGITLNMNVGYKNTNQAANIYYTSGNFSGTAVMPDGMTYGAGSLKPVWQGLSYALGIDFTDSYTNLSTSEQIIINQNNGVLGNYNLVTSDLDTINDYARMDTETFLDLSLYLDYMPHYKKFLQDNPIVYMSLTTDTETGAMYGIPYFDGNNDVEEYELAKKNWITTILEGDTSTLAYETLTFANQVSAKEYRLNNSSYGLTSTSSSCESFMGETGSWQITSTDSSNELRTVEITVSYDNALLQAKTSGSTLNTALKNVGLTDSEIAELSSGNIVDLQNAAINATNGSVTGAQLTDILQAYVDVTYLNSNGTKYYANRADVFNGYDAAWDVDLLVAMMRCVCCYNITNLNTYSSASATYTDNSLVYGLTGRQSTAQRMNDMVELAGQLYGVRGLESRYNYTYINSDGNLQNARADADSYEALDRMHDMAKEGLYNLDDTIGVKSSDKSSYYSSGTCEALMQYDYLNTQTANGGFTAMGLAFVQIEDDYDYEPIVTPVSKWNDGETSTTANVDGIRYSYDENGNKYMRFTESWRSVKLTGGAAVPYASVANDPEKLAAVLAVIDYMFSNDGQILMTYGTQSSTNNCSDPTVDYIGTSDDGWWYGTEVTSVDISTVATLVSGQYYINDEYASQYFCYNNKLYTGIYYEGRQYPAMTNSSLALYYGKTVNGLTQSDPTVIAATAVRSFTNYCRLMLGSCLPVGNKVQALEYQCSSLQGRNGADIVSAGLTNGTISHLYQQVGDDNGKCYWYTVVPTTLPYNSDVDMWIDTNMDSLDNTVFASSSTAYTNFYIDITYYGLTEGHSFSPTYFTDTVLPATAEGCINILNNSYYLSTYITYMQEAWTDILAFYDNYIVE